MKDREREEDSGRKIDERRQRNTDEGHREGGR